MMIKLSSPNTILKWLLVFAVLLLALHLLGQYLYLDSGTFSHGMFELTNRFDMDDEGSLPTWYTQILAFLGAALALLIARHKTTAKEVRPYWYVGFGALLFVSIDEVAQFHELLLQTIHVGVGFDVASKPTQSAWLVILPLLALVATPLLWHFVRKIPQRTAVSLGVGMAVYVLGSVGVEVLFSGLARYTFLRDGLAVGAEEFFELLGLTIIFWALHNHIWQHMPGLRRSLSSL